MSLKSASVMGFAFSSMYSRSSSTFSSPEPSRSISSNFSRMLSSCLFESPSPFTASFAAGMLSGTSSYSMLRFHHRVKTLDCFFCSLAFLRSRFFLCFSSSSSSAFAFASASAFCTFASALCAFASAFCAFASAFCAFTSAFFLSALSFSLISFTGPLTSNDDAPLNAPLASFPSGGSLAFGGSLVIEDPDPGVPSSTNLASALS